MELKTNKVGMALRIQTQRRWERNRCNSLSVDDQAGDSLSGDDIGRPDVFSVEI